MRKPIPKEIREQVYAKYNGHCAYCGCELDYKDMQIDHFSSVFGAESKGMMPDNTIDNLMPSCRMCNYYKGSCTLEQFRYNVQNTIMCNVRRPFDYRLAVKYGLVKENIHPIKFYFEQYDKKAD